MAELDLTCARKYDYYLFDLTKNRVKACCKSPFPIGNVTLEQDFTSILSDRKQLRSGVQIDSCQACWVQEKQGQKSFRSSQSYGAVDLFGEDHKPHMVELIFGNKCNLKCVYCGPDSSSMWKEKTFSKPQLSGEVLQFLKSSWQELELIVLIGGEPALIPEIFTFLEELKKIDAATPTKQKKILKVISNFAAPHGLFQSFIEKLRGIHFFAEVELGASAEALDGRFEYIRDGASFSLFEQNLDYALQFPELNLCLQPTLSTLSISKFHEFLDFYVSKVLSQNRIFDVVYNEVVFPQPLSPRQFPFTLKTEKEKAFEVLQRIPSQAIRSKKRFQNFCDSLSQVYDEVGAQNHDGLSRFLDATEPKRLIANSWRQTFPELS